MSELSATSSAVRRTAAFLVAIALGMLFAVWAVRGLRSAEAAG